jgi:hypothetical protein
MPPPDARHPVLWAPALVPVALGLLSLALVLAGAFGKNPLWTEAELNLSEAAALRDQAAVLRRLAANDDIAARYLVRAGPIAGRDQWLTPVEAAIHEDRVEVLELLFANGAPASPADICGWVELISRRHAKNASAFIAQRYPGAQACVSAPVLERAGPDGPSR